MMSMLSVGNISKFIIKLLHRNYCNAVGVDFYCKAEHEYTWTTDQSTKLNNATSR